MLDFYLLSIIALGLIGGLFAFRLARKAYRDAAMDAHACKVMKLDHERTDQP